MKPLFFDGAAGLLPRSAVLLDVNVAVEMLLKPPTEPSIRF